MAKPLAVKLFDREMSRVNNAIEIIEEIVGVGGSPAQHSQIDRYVKERVKIELQDAIKALDYL